MYILFCTTENVKPSLVLHMSIAITIVLPVFPHPYSSNVCITGVPRYNNIQYLESAVWFCGARCSEQGDSL